MHIKNILTEYDRSLPAIRDLALALEADLRSILAPRAAAVHSTRMRVKERASLEKKIRQPDKIYTALGDITDIIGARIIVYFESGIDDIARLVENSLRVDLAHSVDKRLNSDPTRFGYRSLHYVCRRSPENFPFEIQIRTVLQDAWAEIEHDMGYKSAASLPGQFRRRFSRLAGLLEIADEEFSAIRRDLMLYENTLRAPEFSRSTVIDIVSLGTVARLPPIAQLDAEIADILKIPLSDELFSPDYLVRMSHLAGYTGADGLLNDAQEQRAMVTQFLPYYFQFTGEMWGFSAADINAVERGYCVVFLANLRILGGASLEIDKVGRVSAYYRELEGHDEALARRLAVSLIRKYQNFLDGPEYCI